MTHAVLPVLQRVLLYFHTLRYLRPVQIVGRLWIRVYRPRLAYRPAPRRRELPVALQAPCRRPPAMIGPDRFRFLEQEGQIASAEDWNSVDHAHLWLYNLHYFDDLNAVTAERRIEWHRDLIKRWIEENPPASGVGWEPYPTSLRIVNWIMWALGQGDLSPAALDNLAIQVRWLRRRLEHHLLGNHLLANAKALVFAGLYFDGAEADGWYRTGCRLLDRELNEQILDDGGHFERSPMYHLLVLEDFLDLINMHQAAGIRVAEQWRIRALDMLEWSAVMRHPDGEIPFFNDAAIGISPQPEELDQYGARLGSDAAPLPIDPVIHLPESGYTRMTLGRAVVFADMAPVGPDYLPGHAHADTLSFEFSLDHRRVVVNGGTSLYERGAERQRQRGTAAHATVAIDAQDSSEVWAGFRVARRARVLNVEAGRENGGCRARAAHDGYAGLAGKPIHEREWRLHADSLEIIDQVSGSGTHQVDIMFPLAPAWIPVQESEDCVTFRNHDDQDMIRMAVDVDVAHTVNLEQTSWHPRFGVDEAAWRIRIAVHGTLPIRCTTRLTWG